MEKKWELEWLIEKLLKDIKSGKKAENGVWVNTFITNTMLETIDDIIRQYKLKELHYDNRTRI